MENNRSGQSPSQNAHRNYSSPYNKSRTWFGEKPNLSDKKQSSHPSEENASEKQFSPQKTVATFRDLAIWQKGISLVKTIYQKTNAFPKDELYSLIAQMRRAALSVPSNIAEGYRRRHSKEFQQFLNISLGSLGELETQIIISSELNYLSKESGTLLLEEVDHLTRMVISLSKKVDR
ncbi:MAG: four helix bundle protein [Candidatus Omnitrophota bacterium]